MPARQLPHNLCNCFVYVAAKTIHFMLIRARIERRGIGRETARSGAATIPGLCSPAILAPLLAAVGTGTQRSLSSPPRIIAFRSPQQRSQLRMSQCLISWGLVENFSKSNRRFSLFS